MGTTIVKDGSGTGSVSAKRLALWHMRRLRSMSVLSDTHGGN